MPRTLLPGELPRLALPQRGIFASQDDRPPEGGGGQRRKFVLPPDRPDWQAGTKADHLVEYAQRRWGIDVAPGAGNLINDFGRPNRSLIPPLLVEYGAGHLAGLVTDYLEAVTLYDSTLGLHIEKADIDWLIADFETRFGVGPGEYTVPNPVTEREFDAVILKIRRETLRLYFEAQSAGQLDYHDTYTTLHDRENLSRTATEHAQLARNYFSQGRLSQARFELVMALIDVGGVKSPENLFILQMIELLQPENKLSFDETQSQVLELLEYYKERVCGDRASVQFYALRKRFTELTGRSTSAQVHHVRESLERFVNDHFNVIKQALGIVMTPVLNGLRSASAAENFNVEAAFAEIEILIEQEFSGRTLTKARTGLENARNKLSEGTIKTALDSLATLARNAEKVEAYELSRKIETLVAAIRKRYAV